MGMAYRGRTHGFVLILMVKVGRSLQALPGFRACHALLCRLTPRGFWRPRRGAIFSSRSSRNTLSWNTGTSRGGERRETRHFSAYDPHGMHEG